jgi:hypothetical protein
MRLLSLTSLCAAVVAALAACGTSSAPVLDPAGVARLNELRQAPERAGELVYEGAVFPMPPESAQLFSYQRRISSIENGFVSSHITRDTSGDVVVVESAQFSPTYAVTRFDAIHREAGYSGSVVVTEGRHLVYELNRGGRITRATEAVHDPIVTGPSLHGFIRAHWDTLAAGKKLPVRLVVLAQMETYGFEIARAEATDGRVAFSITPSNFLVRLALDPLRVEFDATSRNVVRYVGRVPPMQRVGGKLAALDARVDYTSYSPSYR